MPGSLLGPGVIRIGISKTLCTRFYDLKVDSIPSPATQRSKGPHQTLGTAFGFLILIVGVVLFIVNGERMTLDSTWILLGILAVMAGGYLIVFGHDYDHPRMLQRVIPLLIPLFVLAILFFITLDTTGAVRFTVEDGPIENLQAMLFFVGAGLFVAAAVIGRRRVPGLVVILGSVIALGLFVVGMEEISWGQRIFDLDTIGVLAENNAQGENNLHNLRSFVTEVIFYTTSVVIFVLLPFFSDRIIAGVDRVSERTGKLGDILRRFDVVSVLQLVVPSRWLVVPFCLVVAFPYASPNSTGTGMYLRPVYMTAITFTAVILVRMLVDAFAVSTRRVMYVIVVSALFLASIFVNTHFQAHTQTITRQMTTEFRELIIAIGVVVYALDTLWKVRSRAAVELEVMSAA